MTPEKPQQTGEAEQPFAFSRRQTMQSALALALFPLTSLNQAQTMPAASTVTESRDTVVAANTKTARDDGLNVAIRPFKYRASDAELAELAPAHQRDQVARAGNGHG